MALLREDGLDAVSMRRVADRLGVAPNSIYAHVADKAALIDELIDAMLAGVPTPTDDGWRARIERVIVTAGENCSGIPTSCRSRSCASRWGPMHCDSVR